MEENVGWKICSGTDFINTIQHDFFLLLGIVWWNRRVETDATFRPTPQISHEMLDPFKSALLQSMILLKIKSIEEKANYF